MNLGRPTAPRMRDVAKRAGVSLVTVSRAFSSPELVSVETRERIDAAIRQLNYTVNVNAQNLRRRSTGVVLVVLPDIANPFFSLVLKGIEETARGTGRAILVGDTEQDPARGAAYARQLDARRADGVILLNGSLPAAGMETCPVALPGYPVVVASERILGADLPTVGIDNERAARDAVGFLARLGHRRIAHLGGPPGNVLTASRKQGYLDGLAAHGLPAGDELIAHGRFSIETGRLASRRLLATTPRPTAVFAANDEMAIGAVIAAKEQGLRVPQEVSVVGFDDIEFAGAYDPPLSTVRQPRREMGRAAMLQLIELLEGRRLTAREIVLPHAFIARASCGPAPA